MTEQVTLTGRGNNTRITDSRNNQVTNDGRVINGAGQTLCTLDKARATAIAQRDLQPHQMSGILSTLGSVFTGSELVLTADAPDNFIPNLCRVAAARPQGR